MDLNRQYGVGKRKAMEQYFRGMNDMQKRAVFRIDGPLLILAGAGSGKTTVLINRIENMIRFGNAYHSEKAPFEISADDIKWLEDYAAGKETDGDRLADMVRYGAVKPWNILAITFTNKAAAELKNRLAAKLGQPGEDVRASTFHSLCMRVLRSEITALGYGSNFTIYDTDDSLRVIRDVMKELNIDEKTLAAKAVLGAIGRAKDVLSSPKDMFDSAAQDFRLESVARVYDMYQKRLRAANALDFDDIIVNTVELFRRFPDVLEKYRGWYKYIMVDEYQDTNHAQYLLISLLAGGHGNLCVVGDDDQSIYKFRGATIENILSFEEQFPDCAVIRLEQNYRSTQNILNAANGVIANNLGRKGKNLWTDAGDGEKVAVMRASDEMEESRIIADSILDHVKAGAKFSDHAVLYRMNAQSGTVERALARNAIPYRVVGGLRFFDHKEIRDMVAYLSVINNPSDSLRLSRIINEPKRGIGSATMASAREISDGTGVDMFEVIEHADEYPVIAKKAAPLQEFAGFIRKFGELAATERLDVFYDELLEKTGYVRMLESQGFEGAGRLENVLELKSMIVKYMQENEEPELSGFLEEIALYTDLDNYDTSADSVTLMTVHSAKGLEFRFVYIAGMDDGVFPGRMSINLQSELEEERRLAYVAITRAKEKLTIISTERRLIFGQTTYNRPSRFITEIPDGLAEYTDTTRKRVEPAAKPEPKRATAKSSHSIGIGGGMGGPRAASAALAVPSKLQTGDRVEHKVFGEGVVLSVKPMASDMLVEIDFGGAGIKKVMANFARLVSLK